MKKIFVSLLTAFSLVTPVFSPVSVNAFSSSAVQIEQKTEPIQGDYIKGEVIVTVVSEKNTALTKEGLNTYSDITVKDTWNFGNAKFLANTKAQESFLSDKDYHVSIVSSEKYSTEELMDLLKNKSHVVHIEPNYYQTTKSISNDTAVEKQWHLSSPNVSVHADTAWKQTGSHTPVVAVVDTGVDYTHEDLNGRMWVNPYTGFPGTYGYDFGDSDADPMDLDGHGTHCAGTIAATINNSTGIAGISKNTKIMALKVFDSSDKSTTGYAINAFNYINSALSYGANIVAVNCSWGGSGSSRTMSDLIEKIGKQGVLFSFAAGNDGKNVEAGTLSMPFDMTNNYVISVGAMASNDLPAVYSNYGATKLTMFAPGDMILSTVNEDTLLPNTYPVEKRNSLLSYYDTANDLSQLANCFSSSQLGIAPSGMFDGVTYKPGTDFENNPAGGCYQWVISNSSAIRNTVYFYVDVTNLNLNKKQDFYVSSILGLSKNGGIEWEHSVMKSSSAPFSGDSRFVTINDKTYFRVIGIGLPALSTQTIYVDEIAITKENPNTNTFGKYEYASGTSMAAPMVTGAIAALAEAFPNDSVSERRTRLLTCTRPNTALIGKCNTMSTLDLSKLNQFVTVSGISINRPSTSCKVKKSIQLRAVTRPANATNPSVKWSVSNSSYASISSNGKFTAKPKGGGKTVTVTVTSNANTSVKASVKIKIPVQKITKIKLSKKRFSLKVGRKKRLKATVYPSYATSQKLKWTSGNKKYATVSSSGVVKARRAGKTVKITAKARDGSGKKFICRVKTIR